MMDDRQKNLLDWAAINAKKPWGKIVRASKIISKGDGITDEIAQVNIPLTPFKADYRQIYPIMKSFGGLITWSPNNLFTIILDRKEKSILRAYMEVAREHNFVKLIPIDPSAPFMIKALEIIKKGDLYPLREHLDNSCQELINEKVNWVKIANIEFFGAFMDNVESFEKSGDLGDWFLGALTAVGKIYDNELIRFTPEPPVFARLRELFTGILQINPDHLDLKSIFGEFKIGSSLENEIGLFLVDHNQVVGFSFGGKEPEKLTIDPAITDKIKKTKMPFHKLAKLGHKLTGADHVIVLGIEPVANLVFEILYNRMPYDRESTKSIIRKFLEILRRFQEQWTMHPLPFYLNNYLRLPAKWLGNPYDINYLASWFLPGVIIDGEAIFLGQHNIRTYATLEKGRILTIFTLEFYDGGIRNFITHGPGVYSDIFADLEEDYNDVKERAIKLGIRLWNDGYGFQNQVVIIQTQFLKTLGQVAAINIWKNPLMLWRLIKPGRKLIALFKTGGVVLYPDKLFFALEAWVKKVGRLYVYPPILSVPFDRKKPRSRGLKYVKSTIFAGVVIALFILIVTFW